MFVISAARGELAETGLGMYSFQELYMPKPLSAKRLLCGLPPNNGQAMNKR